MADLEKVIKGLEHCTDTKKEWEDRCIGCPYGEFLKTCKGDVIHDALELLKMQKRREE